MCLFIISGKNSTEYNFNSSISLSCQVLNTIDLGLNESFTFTLHSSITGVEVRQTHAEVIVEGYSPEVIGEYLAIGSTQCFFCSFGTYRPPRLRN